MAVTLSRRQTLLGPRSNGYYPYTPQVEEEIRRLGKRDDAKRAAEEARIDRLEDLEARSYGLSGSSIAECTDTYDPAEDELRQRRHEEEQCAFDDLGSLR